MMLDTKVKSKMIPSEQCHDIAQIAIDIALKVGATSAECDVVVDTGFSVTARMGAVENIEHHSDQGISLTVYVDHKTGSASTDDLSEHAIKRAVEHAVAIAKHTANDPCAGLADKALMAADIPDCDLCHPWQMTPDKAVELAIECEQAALKSDDRLTNSEGVNINSGQSYRVYANSHGFNEGFSTSMHSANCVLIAKQDEQMTRDYEYTVARNADDLMSFATMANRAAEKTLSRLGSRTIATQKVPVIFRADLSASLLYQFTSAIRGSSIYRHASFLEDMLDKKVFPDFFTMTQVPHEKNGLASRPFDGEGVAMVERDIVKDGVLQNYLLGSYSARKLEMVSTGNAGGLPNINVSTSDLDLDGLLREMGTGLLVTEMIGQGISIVTGDYSRGAFGFWVEGGEIQYPVEGFTIAGNLRDMFGNLRAVGSDIDYRQTIRTGSVLLDEMTVAGG